MSGADGGPLAGRRVLVVEDEYFIADDVTSALKKLGAEVVGPVPTREKALALLSPAATIDIAVLDINLRGNSVFPVADALKELRIPFVFATGYDKSVMPSAYQSAPRWEKPLDPAELARFLPELLHLTEASSP